MYGLADAKTSKEDCCCCLWCTKAENVRHTNRTQKNAVCSIKAINTDKEWHKHTHTRTRLHSEKHKSIVRATPVQHLFHMRIDYVNEWLVGLFFLFDSEIVSSVRVLSICSPSVRRFSSVCRVWECGCWNCVTEYYCISKIRHPIIS